MPRSELANRLIAEAHSGTLVISSVLGEGTRVQVHLPYEQESEYGEEHPQH